MKHRLQGFRDSAAKYGKRAGRYLLVALAVVLVLRGLVGILSPPARAANAPMRVVQRAEWPDDAAKSFAANFAQAYFTYDPGHPGYYEKRLSGFTDGDVLAQIDPSFPNNAVEQSVTQATVRGSSVVDTDKTIIVVAVTVRAQRKSVTQYLGVPVQRGAGGALAVYTLPSLVSGPPLATPSTDETESVSDAESADVSGLVERFFTLYLAGDADGVSVGPAVPGANLGASPVRMQLVSVDSIGALGKPERDSMVVAVSLTAKQGGILLPLGYRLQLTKGDRWYVAKVNKGAK